MMGKIYDDYFVKPRKRRLLVPTHVTEIVTKTLERMKAESRKPGRPRKEGALTSAERQRARRERLKAKPVTKETVTEKKLRDYNNRAARYRAEIQKAFRER